MSRVVSFLFSYWPGKCNLQFGPSSNFSAMLYGTSEQVGRVLSKSSPKMRLCCFCETFPNEYVEMARARFTYKHSWSHLYLIRREIMYAVQITSVNEAPYRGLPLNCCKRDGALRWLMERWSSPEKQQLQHFQNAIWYEIACRRVQFITAIIR